MILNQNTAELIGVIIGDGCIVYRPDISKYYIEISGDNSKDKNYFEFLNLLVFTVIGKYPNISFRSKALRLRFYDKKFVHFLTNTLKMDHGIGKGKRTKIPDEIFKVRSLLVSCIRGIADSDGSVFLSEKFGCKKSYISIEIATTSKILSLQLRDALITFGLRARLRMYHKEGVLPIYRISMNGEEQARLWINEIGFSNSRKASKCLNRVF